jgi:hypothetical protein
MNRVARMILKTELLAELRQAQDSALMHHAIIASENDVVSKQASLRR